MMDYQRIFKHGLKKETPYVKAKKIDFF
jgi:hypothetical protein